MRASTTLRFFGWDSLSHTDQHTYTVLTKQHNWDPLLFLKQACEHVGWADRHFSAHLPFFSTPFTLSFSHFFLHAHTCHHKTGCVVKLPITMLVLLCRIWALSAVPHSWTTINPHTHSHTHSLHFLSHFLTAALSLWAQRLQPDPRSNGAVHSEGLKQFYIEQRTCQSWLS